MTRKAVALALALALTPPAAASDGAALCALPVTASDDASAARLPLIDRIEIFPGLPLPILHGLDARFTIDERQVLAPYPHPVPGSWITEGAGGRVVGIGAEGLLVAEPGSRRFDAVAIPEDAGTVRQALFVPRQARTIVLGDAALMALAGGRLTWLDPPRSTLAGPLPPVRRGIRQVIDLPAHAALAVVAEDGAPWLRRDDGSWLSLDIPPSTMSDRHWQVHELKRPARLLFVREPDMGVVETHGTGAALRLGEVRCIPRGERRGAVMRHLPTAGEVIQIRMVPAMPGMRVEARPGGVPALEAHPRVERLDGDHFVPVAGGDLSDTQGALPTRVESRG